MTIICGRHTSTSKYTNVHSILLPDRLLSDCKLVTHIEAKSFLSGKSEEAAYRISLIGHFFRNLFLEHHSYRCRTRHGKWTDLMNPNVPLEATSSMVFLHKTSFFAQNEDVCRVSKEITWSIFQIFARPRKVHFELQFKLRAKKTDRRQRDLGWQKRACFWQVIQTIREPNCIPLSCVLKNSNPRFAKWEAEIANRESRITNPEMTIKPSGTKQER